MDDEEAEVVDGEEEQTVPPVDHFLELGGTYLYHSNIYTVSNRCRCRPRFRLLGTLTDHLVPFRCFVQSVRSAWGCPLGLTIHLDEGEDCLYFS